MSLFAMDTWFSEIYNGSVRDSVGLTIKIKKKIFSEKTPFQKIEIVETEALGRMLVLDGCVMLTERDEFVYHEMLVHVPLSVHPTPRNV
ncbi:spermidine synthase, partial [Candidatus Woesearchaeota archaeon CG_4_10_14_0_8_um_filter_47_5]